MRKLNVEVHEDSGRPGGGHAVIRLIGLDSLPDSLTYRIKPVDGGLASESGGVWIEGERTPLATRITSEGAELVVGPEVVENPAFLPGTLAVIEIAKCGVRGEFLWPRIAPLVRPKRRHLAGAKPARDPKPEPAPEIQFEEAVDASSHLAPEPASLEPFVPAAATTGATTPPGPAGATAAAPAEGPAAAAEPIAVGRGEPATASAAITTTPRDVAWISSAPSPKSSLLRLAAAAAFGGLLVLGAASVFSSPPATSPENVPIADTDSLVLARLLAVGPTSPRGVDAREASPQQLLEDADQRLHGTDGERDKLEARFLLRRFLAATLAEERTLWALTQLGSVYADPAPGEPRDYDQARQIWELASTLGDPVAMCFLGSLHEHGLGVGMNRDAALKWYRRAKDAGGCKNVDAAIARLDKGAAR